MTEVVSAAADAAVATEHVDVLVVGAGISGIGAAYHLKEQCPDKTYVVLVLLPMRKRRKSKHSRSPAGAGSSGA